MPMIEEEMDVRIEQPQRYRQAGNTDTKPIRVMPAMFKALPKDNTQLLCYEREPELFSNICVATGIGDDDVGYRQYEERFVR